jgi:hypothetical protein
MCKGDTLRSGFREQCGSQRLENVPIFDLEAITSGGQAVDLLKAGDLGGVDTHRSRTPGDQCDRRAAGEQSRRGDPLGDSDGLTKLDRDPPLGTVPDRIRTGEQISDSSLEELSTRLGQAFAFRGYGDQHRQGEGKRRHLLDFPLSHFFHKALRVQPLDPGGLPRVDLAQRRQGQLPGGSALSGRPNVTKVPCELGDPLCAPTGDAESEAGKLLGDRAELLCEELVDPAKLKESLVETVEIEMEGASVVHPFWPWRSFEKFCA